MKKSIIFAGIFLFYYLAFSQEPNQEPSDSTDMEKAMDTTEVGVDNSGTWNLLLSGEGFIDKKSFAFDGTEDVELTYGFDGEFDGTGDTREIYFTNPEGQRIKLTLRARKQNGNLVALGVTSVIWLGLFIYIFALSNKVKKLEGKIK